MGEAVRLAGSARSIRRVRAAGVAPDRTNQSIRAAKANVSGIDGERRADPDEGDREARRRPARRSRPAAPSPASRALAAASRSTGTRRGTSVLMAGRKTASTVPNTTPTAASCQSSTRSPMTRPATTVVRIGAQDVRGEREVARRDPVGQDAADEQERAARDGRGDEDHAEREAGAGQPEDQPRQGDGVELVAQQRDALAQPDEAVVADREGREQRDPADAGRAAAAPASSSVIRSRSARRRRRRRPRGWSP